MSIFPSRRNQGIPGRWALPREGRLDFDYVSARRPPSGSDAISQGYFEQLLELLRLN